MRFPPKHGYNVRHRIRRRTYDWQEHSPKTYDGVRFDDIVYDIVRRTYDILYDIVYDIVYDVVRTIGKNSPKTYDGVRFDDIVYDIVRRTYVERTISYTTSLYDIVYNMTYDIANLNQRVIHT